MASITDMTQWFVSTVSALVAVGGDVTDADMSTGWTDTHSILSRHSSSGLH